MLWIDRLNQKQREWLFTFLLSQDVECEETMEDREMLKSIHKILKGEISKIS